MVCDKGSICDLTKVAIMANWENLTAHNAAIEVVTAMAGNRAALLEMKEERNRKNTAHQEKNEKSNRILNRLSHYNQQIIEGNNDWARMFKNIYYYLLIAFIIVVLVKRDKSLSNLYIVLLALFLPFIIGLILYLIYGIKGKILSFIL